MIEMKTRIKWSDLNTAQKCWVVVIMIAAAVSVVAYITKASLSGW